MRNILLVLTNKYPFGFGENFIEAEREQWGRFSHTYICPVIANSNDLLRSGFCCNNNESLVEALIEKPNFLEIIRSTLGSISILDGFSEVNSIKSPGKLFKLKKAVEFGLKTNYRVNRLKKFLFSELKIMSASTNIFIYAYWMFEPALLGGALKKIFPHARVFSRAHGYDLYTERHAYKYLPFRGWTLRHLDALYSISEHGRQYLLTEFDGIYANKIAVARLGTIKLFPEEIKPEKDKNRIRIVSCAYLLPIKRVGLIAEALKKSDKNITWVHFGDGEQMQELVNKIKELPENIQVSLKGSVSNHSIQEYYANKYVDAFVNVSETEGLPVSIMEAQSYGIPVIATDVGGTSELVQDRVNGVLLKKDFLLPELLEALDFILQQGDSLRSQSKQTWLSNSNAVINYRKFFDEQLVKL